MLGKRLIIVDDEPDIREILKYNLKREGYVTRSYENPRYALEEIEEFNPSIIITDWLMPDIDGLEFCRMLKQNPKTNHIPVVMLSCKNDEVDIVTALEIGAEDYLVKPFKPKELVVRIKKILKRNVSGNEDSILSKKLVNILHKKDENQEARSEINKLIVNKCLIIDKENHLVLLNNEPVDLTYSEFRLLELLVHRPGKVFSRSEIIRYEYGNEAYVTERAVDVKIVNLRKKLGQQGKYIKTIRSVGYKYSEAI